MMKNKDVYDMTDLCSYYGLSESTIRKKVRESRNGESNFPLPLFKRGCKALWRKSDIEAWSGEDGETIHFTPTLSSVAPLPTQNLNETRKRLEKFGISLPKESAPKPRQIRCQRVRQATRGVPVIQK